MKIHLINLKVYWYNEKNDISANKEINKWINFILDKKSFREFSLTDIQRSIEYGDYLFVLKDHNQIKSFAVCSDHPSITYDYWQTNQVLNPHGHLTLSLIYSFEKGFAKDIMKSIRNFAFSMLIRKSIRLSSINAPKLIQFYMENDYKLVKQTQEGFQEMELKR